MDGRYQVTKTKPFMPDELIDAVDGLLGQAVDGRERRPRARRNRY